VAGGHDKAWWDVTIGIIAALPVEGAAMAALISNPLPVRFPEDPNDYQVGHLESAEQGRPHRVALTTMPQDNTRIAAMTCTDMLRTFTGIRCVVMTGIAGGVPALEHPERHVRLGDVVVAVDGIVDYGHVRQGEGVPEPRRPVHGISMDVVRAVRQLQQRLYSGELPEWDRWLAPAYDRPMAVFARPPASADRLHVHDQLVDHPALSASGHVTGRPKIHFGKIGSADVLVVNEHVRDELAARHGVLALEMEAAGVADGVAGRGVGWFLVRGIVDYCDRYKNDRWHSYASLTAAGCVREVLRECRPFPVWRMTPGSGVIALLPDHELDRLTNLLEEVRELDVQDVWHTAIGGLTSLPTSAPGTPAQLAAYLAELNAGLDQVPPALAFVEEVAARVEHGLAAKLRGWIDKAAERLQIVEVMRGHRAATERRRQGRQPAADRPVVRPCLLIQIESDGIDQDRCELRYWVQRRSDDWHPEPGDTQRITFREVELAIQTAIQHAESLWRDNNGPVEIELLLPTDLLHKAVEWWHIELAEPAPTPVCLDYPVVVRSLDRMRAAHRHRVWANRWRAMWRHPPGHRLYWGRVSAADTDLGQWNARLREDPELTTVVLSASPQEALGRDELRSALNAGIPVILWDRRAALQPDVARLMENLAQGDPTELPHHIRVLRSAAAVLPPAEQERHPGRHLALLWDDPGRIIEERRVQP
jgi:nucleoside phosphorylase